MPATSGPSSAASSASATLQQSLENKLRAALDGRGSPLFVLTWKHWAMASGPPICALRASAPRTSGNGCGSWPTPDAQAMNVSADVDTHMERLARLKEKHGNGNGAGLTLGIAAQLASWATPRTSDTNGPGRHCTGGLDLRTAVAEHEAALTKDGLYTTPCADDTGHRKSRYAQGGTALSAQAGGQLNPTWVEWLMGFPTGHTDLQPSETP